MLDYRLSKMCYELHTNPALADEYRHERAPVIARYRLAPAVVQALCDDDVAFLARRLNGFLLRYYFLVVGMGEQEFIAGLQANRTSRDG